MAKSMKPVGELIRGLQSSSAAFETEASHLSEELSVVETCLAGLPGKVTAYVRVESGTLGFHRIGDVWRLTWQHGSNAPRLLQECPIDVKIAAASAVPALLERITELHSEKLAGVRNARAAIEELVAKEVRATRPVLDAALRLKPSNVGAASQRLIAEESEGR